MAFRIYTKTGDAGQTALFGGKRLPKSDLRIDAYGTVDELNACIGIVSDASEDREVQALLKQVQDRLFSVGANLATDPAKSLVTPDIRQEDVQLLENEIDKMEAELPPLKNFILPGGHLTVSYCHLARTVCRRAERLVVALHLIEPVDELVLQYLNRLSDFLFVLSRKLAKDLSVPEVIWASR